MPQNSNGAKSNGTRVIALVGPAGAGKTSVAEAILHAAGATDRHGSVGHGTSIGDSSPESRSRGGSTELNLYNFDYLGDHFALIDCPGSVGFAADGLRGLAVADLAIVVVDPDQARAPLAAPALRALDEQGIPHIIFVNRIDQAHGRIRDLLSALQPVSVSPLIARQIPIREADQITGFVDLALERAFHYNGNDSEQIDIPGDLQDREHEARNQMLEQLADHDDELLEQLLMDQTPSNDRVLHDLARETGESLGVPVLFGSAESSWGIGRLLKALRHEAPGPESSASRLQVSDPSLYVFKIYNGGTVGSVVNHIGFTVTNTQEAVAKWKAAGVNVLPGGAGRTDQAFVETPDGIRIEILENKDQKFPIQSHHVHFNVPESEIPKMQAWYSTWFGAVPGKRGANIAADLPGINLSFSKAMNDAVQVTTKGRTLDHIGFDVKNLQAFLKKYEAAGGKIDRPYTRNEQANSALAFITDPWGTYIELNERPDTPSQTTAAR